MQTAALTALAMIALAANSLLCRWALAEGMIDPASFASFRVVSAAVVLAFLVKRKARGGTAGAPRESRDFMAAAALAVSMLLFSFAHVTIEAGSGALIVFGAAQLTMFAMALRNGPPFRAAPWVGFALALAGLIYLLSPGGTAPPLFGGILMAVAGIGWGVHSLRGSGSDRALESTSRNFVLAVPPVLAIHVAVASSTLLTLPGVLAAVCAGALASAGGYAIWYAALRKLKAAPAATVQLSVPLIAVLGGVVLLAEELTVRLMVSSLAILGGIVLAMVQPPRQFKDT